MATKTNAKSRILDAVHETALDLHAHGFIDKRKMDKLEALCLEPIPAYDSDRIRALRKRLRISQVVLASVLNTSASTVRKWEGGEKHPQRPIIKTARSSRSKRLEGVL